MAAKKRGLGKGLDALLGASKTLTKPEVDQTISQNLSQETLKHLPVDLLQRGKYQPRHDMHSEALEELAQSISKQGVMQPIIVRPLKGNKYEIIAGERRWRASQLAGLETIPAIIRDVADDAAVVMSLIENIQRENLNPIEEAMALQRLQQEFGLTQQLVAEAVGKSRSTVTNLLRLTSLAEPVKRLLEHGDLEMGHARALLTLSNDKQIDSARLVVAKGLSVRQTEALVRKQLQAKEAVEIVKINPDVKALEQRLAERLGAKVILQNNAKGKGKVVIHYNSLDELDGILEHIR